MGDFAYPLPALVITEMIGVPHADQAEFITHSDNIAHFFSSSDATVETARHAQTSIVALTEYFRSVLPERRRNKGTDLISLLLRAEEDGDNLSAEELLAQCSLLLFAGHETTRHLIGNGLLALLQRPDQMNRLRDDPVLMRNAVKELLRFESPVQFIIRLAGEDFELHGESIKTGDRVILFNGAANHDPARFSNPDQLDITRDEGTNLAFGYGPHVCIGATLASLEAEIAFETLLKRCPTIRLLDDPPDWGRDFGFRGLNTLRLAF
jgi:hypothetical protein